MKHIEKLTLGFYFSGRPWYHKDGSPVFSSSGLPRDIEDLGKLDKLFKAAFSAIGARLERYSRREFVDSTRKCQQCGNSFEAKRSTARYCEGCREDVYARRKEQPGYVELNRKRAREGMALLRKGMHKSQNKRGRRKFRPLTRARKKTKQISAFPF